MPTLFLEFHLNAQSQTDSSKTTLDEFEITTTRVGEKSPSDIYFSFPEITNINDFKYEDFELINYDPHPHIKAAVSV